MKSSFFSRSAHFGNVSPFLVGATNTFSELIHPLVKLFWNNSRTFRLQFIRSARLFRLSHRSLFEEQAQALLSYYHFHSFLILHHIYYVSLYTLHFTGKQRWKLLWNYWITASIVTRESHKEGGVANRFLTARRHFWTPWSERTHCMENGQSIFFLCVWGSRASRA